MPLYEYQCGRCGRFEVIRKFSDAPLEVCPTCGQPVQKLLSAPAIQFKGTGWYITDYARKSSGGESAKDGKGKAASGTDGGSKDAGGDKGTAGASGSGSSTTSDTSAGSKSAKGSGSGSGST